MLVGNIRGWRHALPQEGEQHVELLDAHAFPRGLRCMLRWVGKKQKENLVPGSNRIMTELCPRMLSPEDFLCHRQKQ